VGAGFGVGLGAGAGLGAGVEGGGVGRIGGIWASSGPMPIECVALVEPKASLALTVSTSVPSLRDVFR
jgi:hypothetical protein